MVELRKRNALMRIGTSVTVVSCEGVTPLVDGALAVWPWEHARVEPPFEPADVEVLIESVKRTGALLVVADPAAGPLAAEIITQVVSWFSVREAEFRAANLHAEGFVYGLARPKCVRLLVSGQEDEQRIVETAKGLTK